MPPRWCNDSRDELLKELERQQREIERLQREQTRVEQDRDRWRREGERLRRKVDRLEKELAAARRAGYRQAAPFSKGAPKTAPRVPGRRAGAAYGRKARRRVPGRIDERYEAPLPPHCPDCGGPVRVTRHATQYQEDLPPVEPTVRAFDIAIGECTQCHRRVQGRHPLQTSDAIGAAAAQLGPDAVTLAVTLNKQLGMPLGKIATLWRERYGLRVTAGGLVHAIRRAARQAEPTYTGLCATVRGSLVVSRMKPGGKSAATSSGSRRT